MTVEILPGKLTARHNDSGIVYKIVGIKIIIPENNIHPKEEVFYNTNSSFYQAVAAVGTTSKCYIENDKVILL